MNDSFRHFLEHFIKREASWTIELIDSNYLISESEGYKTGYDWAKKQNRDYLLQHFGLYFDQRNRQGLGSLSSKEFNRLNRKGETSPILEDILPSKKFGFLDSDIDKIPYSLSTRKTMLLIRSL